MDCAGALPSDRHHAPFGNADTRVCMHACMHACVCMQICARFQHPSQPALYGPQTPRQPSRCAPWINVHAYAHVIAAQFRQRLQQWTRHHSLWPSRRTNRRSTRRINRPMCGYMHGRAFDCLHVCPWWHAQTCICVYMKSQSYFSKLLFKATFQSYFGNNIKMLSCG